MLGLLAICLLAAILIHRGVDLFSITLAGVVFYYYPVLLFDDIVWLSQGISSSHVYEPARWAVFFIVIAYGAWAYYSPFYVRGDIMFSGKKVLFLSRALLVISLGFAAILLYKYRIYGGGSKADLMTALTYELKIYEAAATMYFLCVHVLGGRMRVVISILLALVTLYIGFRFLSMSFVISYFIINPVRSRSGVACSVAAIFLIAVLLILTKLFYYGIPNVGMVSGILDAQLKGDDIFQNISIANAESSSVSVVFNEILRSNFRIGLDYWGGVVVSLIPAAPIFGLGGVEGFADIYKKSLSIGGADSFAGSMFGLGYATLGFVGLFGFVFINVVFICVAYRVISGRYSAYLKIFASYFLVVSVFFWHRNDVIYNISLIKSAIGVLAACMPLDIFFRACFGQKIASKGEPKRPNV